MPDLNPAPTFHKKLHIKYWQRCLNHALPHHYTSSDASRMTLAFFTLSALDLLDALSTVPQPTRRAYADWIYTCQHPDGGFRGFPGTNLGVHSSPANAAWDPANLPATYFALGALAILQDDFGRLRRAALRRWLKRLQRVDGSFGETLGVAGRREGARDPRFGYCAAAVGWMVGRSGGGDKPGDAEDELDLDAFVRRIRASQTYDGGISDEAFHEPHAGYAYCSIAALSLIDRLPKHAGNLSSETGTILNGEGSPLDGLSSIPAIIKWLVSRQTSNIEEEDDEDDQSFEQSSNQTTSSSAFNKIQVVPISTLSFFESDDDSTCAGFNGRVNKIADTCYTFWVGGSLKLLDSLSMIDIQNARRYLLEQTQHPIMGGFSKFPGDPPDLYHAYMGLAALSLLNEENEKLPSIMNGAKDGIERLDPSLCFSVRAREWIERLGSGNGKSGLRPDDT